MASWRGRAGGDSAFGAFLSMTFSSAGKAFSPRRCLLSGLAASGRAPRPLPRPPRIPACQLAGIPGQPNGPPGGRQAVGTVLDLPLAFGQLGGVAFGLLA